MKNLYRNLTIAASFAIIAAPISAQTIQGTIKPGSQPNSIIVAIKASGDIVDSKVSTFYFSLGVPVTADPRPTVSILNNFNAAIGYPIQVVANPELVNGVQHWIYNFLGDGSQVDGVQRTITTADNNMAEIAFNGGVGSSEIKVISLPDGGSTSNSFFNIFDRGTDKTNQTAMFYGGTPINSANGYSGLSFTQLGNVALPVSFLNFFALKNNDNAKLSWTVENDELNSFFDIERSLDGVDFKPFGKVQALQNGKSTNTYESADERLSSKGAKTIYYRIKQVDKTGTVTYSTVRFLDVDKNGEPLSLFPNPARSTTKLVMDVENAGRAVIAIRDLSGKQVQNIAVQLQKGVNQQDLNVSQFASGEYNISVYGPSFNPKPIKLIKIN